MQIVRASIPIPLNTMDGEEGEYVLPEAEESSGNEESSEDDEESEEEEEEENGEDGTAECVCVVTD